jgi:predicted DNA-binding WGR domain protein
MMNKFYIVTIEGESSAQRFDDRNLAVNAAKKLAC